MYSQERAKSSKKRRRSHPSGSGQDSDSDDDNEIISVYSDSSNDGGNLSSNASTPESAKIDKNKNEALPTQSSALPQKRAAHDSGSDDNNKSDAGDGDDEEKYFTAYRTVQVPKGVTEGQLFHVVIQNTATNTTKDVIGVTCPKGVKAGDTILLVEPGSSPPLSPPQIAKLNEQRLLKGIDTKNAKWVAISFWKIVWPVLVEEGWWCRKESLFNFGAVTIYSPTYKKLMSSSGGEKNITLNQNYFESISAVLKCDTISPALVHKCYADAEKRKLASLKANDYAKNYNTNAAGSSGRRSYSALDRWKYPNGITALKRSRVGGNYQAPSLPKVGTFSKKGNDSSSGDCILLEPLVNLQEHDKVNPTWLEWANDETFANVYHFKIMETKKEFRPLAALLKKPIGFCLWYYYCRYKTSDKYVLLKNLLRGDGREHVDECVICDDGGGESTCDTSYSAGFH